MSDDTNLIGTGRLAYLLDVSRQRVSQLVAAGVLARKGRGRFEMDASVRSYIQYLKTQPFGADGSGGALDYAAERARLTKLTADKVAHELTVLQGRMIAIDAAVAPVAECLNLVRQRLLGLAPKCAQQVVGQDAPGAFAILQAEVIAILTELTADAELQAKADEAAARDAGK